MRQFDDGQKSLRISDLFIVALILVARKASYPQALMKPYRKGER
jgi:hypothetical protein